MARAWCLFDSFDKSAGPFAVFSMRMGAPTVVSGKTCDLFQQRVKVAPLADLLDQEVVVAVRGPHLHDAVASLRALIGAGVDTYEVRQVADGILII